MAGLSGRSCFPESALTEPAALEAPSAWVVRFAPQIPAGGSVLDMACGAGRHARFLAGHGYRVLAVDIDAASLQPMNGRAGIETLAADLEGGPWPFAGRLFDGIVVTRYLHRPLLAPLLDALAPGGVLIYETFAAGNERCGRPRNPEFLLQSGELLERVRGCLQVLAYEDLYVDTPKPAMMQRICAVRPPRENSSPL
jgi:SAM-dependent methyltransferase